ncbi:hypothetical protein Pcinc_024316 [Petrolisthes cinctipes]|uniref:Receptor ligand binding region domain-containing protein n=1 Tax=Petrolisthes cinctipes TaxID=88211 RepID=A0AAE1FAN0_PETCI|nr:hypothetical protein Pcinc_024316 [Petrolisthes cinctipes]
MALTECVIHFVKELRVISFTHGRSPAPSSSPIPFHPQPLPSDTLGTWVTKAQSALIYDAVRVVAEALTRLMRKKAEHFGEGPGLGSARMISCNTDVSDKSIWEHGEKITRHMRKVEMEGLTGNISFTDEGKRKHYSIDVVEMTFNSETVRVSVNTP